jgi:hypothetical protein
LSSELQATARELRRHINPLLMTAYQRVEPSERVACGTRGLG